MTPEEQTAFAEKAAQIAADKKAERDERARYRAKKLIAAQNAPQLPPLVCLTVPELYAQPSTDYLVDGLLAEGALAELIGDSESMKSFFAIHLGLSIATDRDAFFGQPIIKHGPVIYIAAEGGGAFQYRVRAWATRHDVDLRSMPFHTIPVPVNLRDEKFQAVLHELIGTLKPVLIIVDTLHRCTPGIEENSSGDIGEVVAFAQRLQYDFRAAVLFIHHPPKNDPKGRGRGSGSLYNAADTEIQASIKGQPNEDGTKVVEFKVQKQKDDQKIRFELASRIVDVLGDDGRPLAYKSGRAIRTCVLEVATPDDLKPMEKSDQRIRQVLDYVNANPGQPRTTVIERVGGKEKDTNKAIDDLLERGVLRGEKRGRALHLFEANLLDRAGDM